MRAEDFADFFRAIHGEKSPYAWQTRLAAQVINTGRWPAVEMPTGSGKTSVLDIAVFHLALEAGEPPEQRRAARRICYVIDRRVVVDQAYALARDIAGKLQAALQDDGGILREVAERLLALGGESPLQAVEMRGGLHIDETWMQNPLQPTIIASTVDQVGSRLLLRGYGLNPRVWPIHAGLLGNDSLIVLDEAHISQAFAQTVRTIQRYRAKMWPEQAKTPFGFVEMSATLPTERPQEEVFSLREEDIDENLRVRLEAPKTVELANAPGGDRDDETKKAELLVRHTIQLATELAEQERRPVVALVANTVRTARDAFARLQAGQGGAADVVLLTGRMRPYDRAQLLERYAAALDPKRSTDPERPTYVVATQTIEVGADYDFDALVTEAAPLDALTQRFGRLNRAGKPERQGARAVIVKAGSLAKAPVYGASVAAAWAYLEGKAKAKKGRKSDKRIDISTAAIRGWQDITPEMQTGQPMTPVLMPRDVDALAQTNPEPMPHIDIATYLHGFETAPADVQVIWRADLPKDLSVAASDAETMQAYQEIIRLLPPRREEAIALPVGSVRAWLQGQKARVLADVEGVGTSAGGNQEEEEDSIRPALRWDGEGIAVIRPQEIRPGDTLIVPSGYGGCDEFGWNPESGALVPDIAELARNGRAVLRIHPAALAQYMPKDAELPKAVEEDGEFTVEPALKTLAASAGGAPKSQVIADLARGLLQAPGLDVCQYPGTPYAVVAERSRRPRQDAVALEAHTLHVGKVARRFSEALLGDARLRADIELAALLHDLGKADPRFQTGLRGGDALAARLEDPLAKGSGNWRPTWRHEYASLSLARAVVAEQAQDEELVAHLIGTHHGHGRAIALPEEEGQGEVAVRIAGRTIAGPLAHGLYRLDSGWVENFLGVMRRYGPWGAAYLEAILRLADWRASQDESRGAYAEEATANA